MRKCDRIDLTEHETSESIPLTVAERDALSDESFGINITPVKGEKDIYTLRPGSIVGALEIEGLSLHIKPKLKIERVLWLACYALGAFDLRREPFSFKSEQPELIEVLAQVLGDAAGKAFARGLLQGYRVEEEALHTVRGRIMVAEQIRRRFDMPLPVEVRYDEYTEDILPNRLIKAAAALLGRMRLNNSQAREGLRHIDATLVNVMPVRYPPNDVPEVKFDRLNGHYEEVVGLARLVLAHQSFEPLRDGEVRARGLLVDMNKVFEGFVVRALREQLGVSEHTLRQGYTVCTLAESGKFDLKPDLSWWDGGYGYAFVGDAKYKRIESGVQNADLYQALAYATALDLPGALLAYAKGETGELVPASYAVRNANKRIEVVAVDLTGDIPSIRASIKVLAKRVRCLRAEDLALREKAAGASIRGATGVSPILGTKRWRSG